VSDIIQVLDCSDWLWGWQGGNKEENGDKDRQMLIYFLVLDAVRFVSKGVSCRLVEYICRVRNFNTGSDERKLQSG
jgi:hypothetical protein